MRTVRPETPVKGRDARRRRVESGGNGVRPDVARRPEPATPTPGFWIVLSVALVATWLTYLPSLSGEFIFDDKALPFTNPDAATRSAAFWIGGVRPVLMASYWLNFLTGASPFAYHAVNLGLHALAAALAYLCAWSLLGRAGIDKAKINILAILTAGIFLLHPLQAESVAYIAGRSEVLTGVFILAAFAIFLRAPRSGPGYGRVLGILALFGAALLSKEQAVAFPVLLVFTGIYWTDGLIAEHFRKYVKLYGSLLVLGVIAGILVLRRLATAESAGFHVEGITWFDYLLTQFRVVPTYLRLFVAPFGQSADWLFPFSHSPLEHGAIFYGLALAAAVLVSFRYRRRLPALFYGLVVFLILLAPTSSVIPIKDALAERRMYLPIIGLAFATASLAGRLRLSHTALKITVLAILAVASGISYQRSAVWSSEILFWKDVVAKSPSNVRAYEALGSALAAKHRCAEAIEAYKKGLPMANAQGGVETPVFQLSLASAFVCNQQPAMARETLRGMSSKAQERAVILTDSGVLAAKAKDDREALDDFNEAIRLDPKYAPPFAYRGLLEYAAGANAQAEQDFLQALNLDPNNTFALDGIRKLAQARTDAMQPFAR